MLPKPNILLFCHVRAVLAFPVKKILTIGGIGMDIKESYVKIARYIPQPVIERVSRAVKGLPLVKRMIEKEYQSLKNDLRKMLKPYEGKYPQYNSLPETGVSREEIINLMEEFRKLEEPRWKRGYASGTIYHGGEEHISFLNQIYAINSQSNPLHSDLWPSTTKFEQEIISMTASMLGKTRFDEEICGAVTSGGTESIFLAMKAYRDYFFEKKRIKKPEIVVPESAHAAFEKAAQCLGLKLVKIPLNKEYKADVKAVKKALNKNTIALVGSAPSFPHGIIDPIEEMSDMALKAGTGFHTDACLGGFFLPWAERLGYPVPKFDFRLPGVTSISVDTHKYGYAPKGTSVILYRTHELRHYQYFKFTDWQGGIYCTPCLPGSRPGALIAACWAALVSTGEDGYLNAAEKILKTAEKIKAGIESIPGIYVIGDPLWVIAFGSDTVDIYDVMEHMTEKNWSLNALQNPPAIHICVTLRHTEEGVAERFLHDLEESVKTAKHALGKKKGVALYGLAATFPDRRLVGDALALYIDTLLDP